MSESRNEKREAAGMFGVMVIWLLFGTAGITVIVVLGKWFNKLLLGCGG